MLEVESHVALTGFNSFGFAACAEHYVEIERLEQLPELEAYLRQQPQPLLLLGGGSNLLLAEQLPGLVARICLKGRQVSVEGERVLLTLAAGENWHESVEYSVNQGWYGLENLALIPGTVGAAPVQNIGAYGVELCQRLRAVQVFDRERAAFTRLLTAECQFSYRDSLFKSIAPERYIITALELELSTRGSLNLSYGALQQALAETESPLTPRHVFEAVCRIRRSKLPDPLQLGNAGSYFKNPSVSADHHARLKQDYPDLVSYPDGERFKLAAGWLIERAGWKGHRQGDVGVHAHQALVLVNYGGATREQVLTLANAIVADIAHRFAVTLEMEPRCYPSLD